MREGHVTPLTAWRSTADKISMLQKDVLMKFRSLAALPCVFALALATHDVPARAQQLPLLRAPTFDVVEPAFTDRDVSQFVTTLDGWLAAPQQTATSAASFWDFARGLQTGRLTSAQEARVMQHLVDVERAHPAAEDTLDKLRHMVSALTIGKTAPEIAGHDLDGNEFKLSDYRGKVVVLVFSGASGAASAAVSIRTSACCSSSIASGRSRGSASTATSIATRPTPRWPPGDCRTAPGGTATCRRTRAARSPRTGTSPAGRPFT